MSDYSGKRITVRFCTQEVIDMIEALPKGYKSMIVESAVAMYRNSEAGNKLFEQLNNRKKQLVEAPKQIKSKKPISREHLTGDF
ncbi:MAG: hypothetical protein WA081_18995 [Desulfosalsimonadaceae bacterium]